MKVKFLKKFRKKYTYIVERNEYGRDYVHVFKSDFSEKWCIDTIAQKTWLYRFIYNNRSDFGGFFIFTLIMFEIRISRKEKQRQKYLGKLANIRLYEGLKNGTIKTID